MEDTIYRLEELGELLATDPELSNYVRVLHTDKEGITMRDIAPFPNLQELHFEKVRGLSWPATLFLHHISELDTLVKSSLRVANVEICEPDGETSELSISWERSVPLIMEYLTKADKFTNLSFHRYPESLGGSLTITYISFDRGILYLPRQWSQAWDRYDVSARGLHPFTEDTASLPGFTDWDMDGPDVSVGEPLPLIERWASPLGSNQDRRTDWDIDILSRIPYDTLHYHD